ncbi:MAG: VWA domain-containing protein [Proteobacteria bacterium]|nr:VWA domain-containing protein [Pseudomonadota bacterium]
MNIRIVILCLIIGSIMVSKPVHGDETALNHVVIVLDASGSMGDVMGSTSMKKMDAAKEALIKVIQQISPDTRVGLLVFSSSNLTDDWVYPLAPLDQQRLIQAINLPVPGGKTPLGVYIKKAADRLLAERSKQFGYGTYRLLIVTDGEAQDQELVDIYTPDVISRGITMDVIGVSMPEAHTLATHVHSYRKADDPESLIQALGEVFAEVGSNNTSVEGKEDFTDLASIPDELAQAMLSALATTGNQPIGRNLLGSLAKPLVDTPGKSSQKPLTRPSKSRSMGGSIWGIVMVVIVMSIIISSNLRRRKRKRR